MTLHAEYEKKLAELQLMESQLAFQLCPFTVGEIIQLKSSQSWGMSSVAKDYVVDAIDATSTEGRLQWYIIVREMADGKPLPRPYLVWQSQWEGMETPEERWTIA